MARHSRPKEASLPLAYVPAIHAFCGNSDGRSRRLALRLHAADIGRGRRNPEFGFKDGDARLQRLVFLARQARHVLDRLELLALDDVEIAQEFFGLVAHHRVELALHALCRTRGVIHQATDLVEKPVVGLGHGETPAAQEPLQQWRSMRHDSSPADHRKTSSPCHAAVSLQSYCMPQKETAVIEREESP